MQSDSSDNPRLALDEQGVIVNRILCDEPVDPDTVTRMIWDGLRQKLADGHAEMQIFVNGLGALGPGALTEDPHRPGLFTIVTQAQMGKDGPIVHSPITIHVRQIFGFTTGPLSQGAPMIVTPGQGSGPGGLHLGRGRV